jgi:hypothetical protein
LTLVEVLITVAILSSALVLILGALVRGAYALEVAKHRTHAYTFSSVKMADVELSLKQGLEPKMKGEFRMGHSPFEWRLDMTPIEEEPKLQLVTLTVGWRQGRHEYASQVSTITRVPEEEGQQ